MPTSVVSYRSPFDGDVDPGLPPWKRDLILRRRAMSRTLGTPLTGTLDVASILAMSRSSSGGITGIVRNPPERATNSTKQRMAEPKERAKDTDKPKPASKNMSQPVDAPPARHGAEARNSWASTGSSSVPRRERCSPPSRAPGATAAAEQAHHQQQQQLAAAAEPTASDTDSPARITHSASKLGPRTTHHSKVMTADVASPPWRTARQPASVVSVSASTKAAASTPVVASRSHASSSSSGGGGGGGPNSNNNNNNGAALPNRRSIKKFFSADFSASRKRSDLLNDDEFEYGPGFVNKLRTKFINLTLQQEQNLRRVASLENILDDKPKRSAAMSNGSVLTAPGGGVGTTSGGASGLHAPKPKVRRELLKARSMETLLAVVSDSSGGGDAAHCDGDKNELPPPDTVKSIKKLYEPSSPRRTVPRKPTTTSTNTTQAKMNYKNTLQRNVNVPKATPRPKLDISTFEKPQVPAKPVLIMRKKPPVPPKTLTNSTNNDSKPEQKTIVASAKRDSDSDSDERFKSDDEEDEPVATVKPVSVQTVENIRASGTSVNFNFSRPNNLQPRQIGVIRPITKLEEKNNRINQELNQDLVVKKEPVLSLTKGRGGTDVDEPDTTAIRPQQPQSSALPAVKFGDLEGNNQQILSQSSSSFKATTVAKSEINSCGPSPLEKADEISKKKDELIAAKAPATKRTQASQQQQNNSLQFNFSKREFVPDYIENDGLDLSKRSIKLIETGVIRLGGVGGESATDEDDLILARLTIRPPSPCNVEFVNANIIVAGKSSMRKNTPSRSNRGRLSFNDAATETFEYPSEKSLLDDHLVELLVTTTRGVHVNGGDAGSTISSAMDARDGGDASSKTSQKTFPGAVATGSGQLGGLASYTPSKIPMGTTFELGVTRTVAMTPANAHLPTTTGSSSTTARKDEEPAADYLKETSTGETFTQAGVSADLLF